MAYNAAVSTKPVKVLVIRFSSFGDVVQALSIPSRLKDLSPNTEIHWITRSDLAPLLEEHPHITCVWRYERSSGLSGLWKMIQGLRAEKFTHIFDAHNNLRSHLISCFLRPPLDFSRWFSAPLFVRKSQKRWKRFLLFRFHKNTYQMPFSGQRDLLEPLSHWGLTSELPSVPQIFVVPTALEKIRARLNEADVRDFVVLAPSAAYELKRWPLDYWKTLIAKSKAMGASLKFVVVGGPTDEFLRELTDSSSVLNWAGTTNLQETTALVSLARALVSNDTGVLHLGEQLGKPTIALMGPAPFGFPSRPSTRILQLDLPCRPCSKHGQGPCVNTEFHKCLRDIKPEQVHRELMQVL